MDAPPSRGFLRLASGNRGGPVALWFSTPCLPIIAGHAWLSSVAAYRALKAIRPLVHEPRRLSLAAVDMVLRDRPPGPADQGYPWLYGGPGRLWWIVAVTPWAPGDYYDACCDAVLGPNYP